MPTIELDPGERHTMVIAPLTIEVTGAEGIDARLTALDQADTEKVTQRMSATEILLTPEPRRVRIVVQSGAVPFPGQTRVGLVIRTLGGNVVSEQVVISPVDVGALKQHEFAVLEFAVDRAICSATAIAQPVRETPVPEQPPVAQAPAYEQVAPSVAAPATPAAPASGADARWMEAGRYAFRNGRDIAASESAPHSWAVVLDGSASMERLYEGGQIGALVALVCGIQLEWTGVSGSGAVVGGIRPFEVPNGQNDPESLARSAFDGAELSSWSSVGEAASKIAATMGAEGSIVILTDGVPGDTERLVSAAQAQPRTRFQILTIGRSVHGLAPDGALEWWEEELAGLHALAALPNVRIAALRTDASGRPVYDESRGAHLAARFAGPHPQAVLR